jgi:hypothetical protein
MKFLSILYIIALFFVLTPGIFLSLPPGGSKTTIALTHAVVFGLVWHLTHKIVKNAEKYELNTSEMPEEMNATKNSKKGIF